MANCLVPVPEVWRIVTFKVIASRQAQKLGVQLLQCFHQVLAVTIRAIIVRGGKQTDEVEVEGTA